MNLRCRVLIFLLYDKGVSSEPNDLTQGQEPEFHRSANVYLITCGIRPGNGSSNCARVRSRFETGSGTTGLAQDVTVLTFAIWIRIN